MKMDKKVDIPREHPKIAIIGHSGSGKSTLAASLGERFSVPVLHMDTIHFLPNWVERELPDELAIMRAFLDENDEEGWAIDGNYRKLEHERRMEEADLIIYLNFNKYVCFCRAWRRSRVYRNKTRPSIALGCNEKFDKEFRHWILKRGRTKQKLKNYRVILEAYPEKSVEIKNPRALKRFLKEL
jgi:adenylate kinase family enzyme